MSRPLVCLLVPLLLVFSHAVASAQTQPPPAPTPHPDEGKAIELLQSIAERVPSLRSSTNRMWIGCAVADLLWDRDEKQARALFEAVMKNVAESTAQLDFTDQESFNELSLLYQQRQKVIEVIARRDPELALTFLRSTRPDFSSDKRAGNFAEQERNLELSLAALASARNPEFALKIGRATLKRGLTYNHVGVLMQLQQKNPSLAQAFYGEMVDRFNGEDLAQNFDAFNVAWNLLTSFQPPQAKEETYRRLVDTLTARVLAISPTDSTRIQVAQNIYQQMRWSLPNVEKISPARAQALRDWSKGIERTFDVNTRMYNELNEMSQGTVEDILALRSKYPEEMHLAISQQAVWKALNNGEFDRARQLARETIPDPVQRQQLLAQIDNNVAWKAANENQITDARRLMSKVKQLDQRIQMMTQLATNLANKGDKEGALEILNDARGFLETAPQNSQKYLAQLQLIRSYCGLRPDEAGTMLQPFISQLNQIIAAAAVLDGFENHYFQDGEWSAQGYYSLNGLVTNVDQALGQLAAKDFSAARTLADQLERPEVRLVAHLSIVQGVLSSPTSPNQFSAVPQNSRRLILMH